MKNLFEIEILRSNETGCEWEYTGYSFPSDKYGPNTAIQFVRTRLENLGENTTGLRFRAVMTA